MAAETLNANLYGVVDLTKKAGNYNLSVNASRLNTLVDSAVRVVVDSSKGDYSLNLPKVSGYAGLWGAKIMIVDLAVAKGGQVGKVTINADKDSQDSINGRLTPATLGGSGIATLEVAYNNRYAGLGLVMG